MATTHRSAPDLPPVRLKTKGEKMTDKKQSAEEWLTVVAFYPENSSSIDDSKKNSSMIVNLSQAKKALSMAREESRQETAKKIFRELDIARRKGMGFYMRSSEYNLIKAKWVKED